jgi:hypothetical protein
MHSVQLIHEVVEVLKLELITVKLVVPVAVVIMVVVNLEVADKVILEVLEVDMDFKELVVAAAAKAAEEVVLLDLMLVMAAAVNQVQ